MLTRCSYGIQLALALRINGPSASKCSGRIALTSVQLQHSTIHYYTYSTINAPDKGEVGGSSPPRPTIQITSKYAAILTFPLSGNISQKTNLPTICQLYDWPDGTALRALNSGEGQTASIDSAISRTLPSQVEGRARSARYREAVEGAGRYFSQFSRA